MPYNLRVFVKSTDTIVTIAYKFLGDRNKAWVLDHYNGFGGRNLRRGDVVLVPLTDLPLTPEGRSEARRATAYAKTEGGGSTRRLQTQVDAELPALIRDVRTGRYALAVARGNGFLASTKLSKLQLGIIHRQLLEAYTALGVLGRAAESCTEWQRNDPDANLDPNFISPKVLAACQRTKK